MVTKKFAFCKMFVFYKLKVPPDIFAGPVVSEVVILLPKYVFTHLGRSTLVRYFLKQHLPLPVATYESQFYAKNRKLM